MYANRYIRRKPFQRRRFQRPRKLFRSRVPYSLASDNARRYVKLRGYYDLTVNQERNEAYAGVNDDPSNTSEFKFLAGVFSKYRVNAISIRYLPYMNTNQLFPTAGLNLSFRPILVAHDVNSVLGRDEINATTMSQYQNLKYFESCKSFNAYYKMHKNISLVGKATILDNHGYYRVSEPQASQIIHCFSEVPGSKDLKASSLGKIIITYYCVFKNN